MPDMQSYRQIQINSFAIRSFRDVADQDYIVARLAYRVGLYSQFRWAALQAIEKYFKGILLLNRIKAKSIGHDLGKALELTSRLPFDLRLSESSRVFIQELDQSARFRYLEGSYHVWGAKIVELDRTVWEIRRYCRPLNYELKRHDGSVQQMLDAEIATIVAMENQPKWKMKILGGRLERILEDRHNPAREALVHHNMFFGAKTRHRVKMKIPAYSENAPLWLHPEILGDVLEYIFLPKDVAAAYREVLRQREAEIAASKG
jgi:HEPN domain-containing protein